MWVAEVRRSRSAAVQGPRFGNGLESTALVGRGSPPICRATRPATTSQARGQTSCSRRVRGSRAARARRGRRPTARESPLPTKRPSRRRPRRTFARSLPPKRNSWDGPGPSRTGKEVDASSRTTTTCSSVAVERGSRTSGAVTGWIDASSTTTSASSSREM